MTKFTIERINAISCHQEFDQLVIAGTGQLDIFEKGLNNTTYQSEFKTLLAYMEYLGNNGSLPKTKFRDVTPKGEKVKEYEFKRNIFVYMLYKKTMGKS